MTTERTHCGEQYVIVGAERVSLTQIAAAAPLRANKPQQACDVGLFSDDANQLDLIDMVRSCSTNKR